MKSDECDRVKKSSGAAMRTFTIAKRAYVVSGIPEGKGAMALLEHGLAPISISLSAVLWRSRPRLLAFVAGS